MRVERYSAGYHLTEMLVEPGPNRPRVNDADYRTLQHEVHDPGTDSDEIVFQLDSLFFPVEPSQQTPLNVLELPAEALQETQVKHPPARREILIPDQWLHRFLKEPELPRNEVF